MARSVKTSGVSRISVVTTAECEEPVAALLERIYGVTPTVYTDAETQESTVTAYVRAVPAKLRRQLPEIEASLEDDVDEVAHRWPVSPELRVMWVSNASS